jgi:hypothetical protein
LINYIGITGKAGSGKSTAADFIKAQCQSDTQCLIIPFAKRLKELATLAGWDGKKDAKGRKFLQDFGELMRRYDKDYWVKEWMLEVSKQQTETNYYRGFDAPKNYLIIVDDVRYNNEAEEIIRRGGKVLKVYGRGGLTKELGEHSSELGINPEYISKGIDNSGIYADLAKEIQND